MRIKGRAAEKPTPPASTPGMVVELRGSGNPDMRQYADVAEPKTVRVKSLKEAAAICMKYIEENELGAGNWGGEGGIVRENGKQIARIAYNGKIFTPDYPPLK